VAAICRVAEPDPDPVRSGPFLLDPEPDPENFHGIRILLVLWQCKVVKTRKKYFKIELLHIFR